MNSTTKYFYNRDQIGSIRELTDNSGVIQAQYVFDPFGRVTKLSESTASDFGFARYFVHTRSGLNLTKRRAYNASFGRWINRDPISERGGMNLFAYVHNNTISRIDPSGLQRIPPSEPSPDPDKPVPNPDPDPDPNPNPNPDPDPNPNPNPDPDPDPKPNPDPDPDQNPGPHPGPDPHPNPNPNPNPKPNPNPRPCPPNEPNQPNCNNPPVYRNWWKCAGFCGTACFPNVDRAAACHLKCMGDD